ncbi:FHA domain-containing protein [Chiayiivirga flava]|uniref:PSer/pThr/pTyr-binding forkhead associated (FHA) protein n=1 Tax=Chiayiivirga flava TaxID=659595 RepID=A0A7W8G005_9GAMM|nr:FHA domain-containing protein [Chiayiivirga flava]MBB5207203.1 pSer/pThr/pTyr-binding forkhead associated (FHA) protein [Chiayiivirga flava]
MKLFFPNGEHPQALLSTGENRVGNASTAQIALTAPNIVAAHCTIELDESEAVTLLPGDGVTTVNGKPVATATPLRAGDLLGFADVQARLVAVEKAGLSSVPRPAPVDDSGATRVRMAVPKLVLRGVSGAAFGKTFPISGPVVIGRQADCDISIPSEEISRRHAQLKPTPAGLAVEDLGSSNGTYINGKRVQSGLMRPGEELRLDTIRFLLVAPGLEMPGTTRPATAASAAVTAVSAAPKRSGAGGVIAVVVLVLAAAAAAGWYVFLR